MASKSFENELEKMLHVVEHALSMYAYSFVHFPAHQLYEKDMISKFQEVIDNCHIYLIGHTPKIRLESAREEDGLLILTFIVLGVSHDVEMPIPDGAHLRENDGYFYLEDASGQRRFPSAEVMGVFLQQQTKAVTFNVKYVGQAFGSDGSRNAVDRLMKHETLQKISLKGIPDGHELSICLLEVQSDNKLITVFNPKAQNDEDSDKRTQAGLDKLFNTDEHERITLYEASLIRYFEPEFNKEFKNSFPSTNLKVLADCYEKDFSAVIAEICFDHMPFYFCSEKVEPAESHSVRHLLHEEEDRKSFFHIGG